MATNINEKPYDESTRLKLEIFGECFEEWLPVFISDKHVDQVFIFDFFAGSGTDSEDHPGSPLILMEKAQKYCVSVQKKITLIFNEQNKAKTTKLKTSIKNYIEECQAQRDCENCVYDYRITQEDFKFAFRNAAVQKIFQDKKFGKFVLLDQYGFSQIDANVFLMLVNSPKTDFIFFISSSFIKRFQRHEYTKRYIDTESLNFDDSKPKECHKVIAAYFRSLIPAGKEYYLHHFTIQKESNKGNYYGLIFGTNHTYGMEKFLKVCWGLDPNSGESNCNMYDDYKPDTFFHDPIRSNKKKIVEKKIENEILHGNILNNHSGFKYTMREGCEPKLFTGIVLRLEKEGKIKRTGSINNKSTKVHGVPIYQIKVI